MRKRPTSSPKSLGEALEELVGTLGIKTKLQEYEAVVQWPQIVGERIAQEAAATRIAKGVLFVKVRSGVWRNELTLRKKEIMNRINATLGGEVVKDIKFQ